MFTNCAEDGSVLPPDDPLVRHLAGNEGWHTDSSFQERSAKASILSAHRVPSAGGSTEWADMRAAYDALDAATRERVLEMSAFHSLYYSQSRIGIDPSVTASANARLVGQPDVHEAVVVEAPLRPLVKVHPVTGRPALFVGRHAYGIAGLEPGRVDRAARHADRRGLPATAGARTPVAARRHRVWDNRCVLHRARPYDPTQGRYMVHTRVNGESATEHAAMVPAPSF